MPFGKEADAMSLFQQLRQAGIGIEGLDNHLFLLAEAWGNPGLLGRLEFHVTPHRCLWHLEREVGLEKHAPWLFQLTCDSDLDRWLGSARGDLGFTVIDTGLPLDALTHHLRRFSKVQQGRQRYLLRLGDPKSLSLYIGSLAQQAEPLAQLFANGQLRTLYFQDPKIGLSQGVQPLFEQSLDTCEPDGYLAWLLPTGEGYQ